MTIVLGDFGGKGSKAEEGIYPQLYPIKKPTRIEWLLLNMLPLNHHQTLIAPISYLRKTIKI